MSFEDTIDRPVDEDGYYELWVEGMEYGVGTVYTAGDETTTSVSTYSCWFFTPGVAPDPRGILLGRFCLMTFPTLEGAVSWLRLYSAEASLDELMAGLSITKAKTALGSREIVIQHAGQSYRLRVTRANKLILTK